METKHKSWRQYLIDVSFPNIQKLSDEEITKMLFRPSSERAVLLKWIASELSQGSCKSEEDMIKVLSMHVYIPNQFQKALTKTCQKEFLSKFWVALFKEIMNKKEGKYKVTSSLSDCMNVPSIDSVLTVDDEDTEISMGNETISILNEFNLIKQRVDTPHLTVEDQTSQNLAKRIEKYMEFIDTYSNLVKPLLQSKSNVQDSSELELNRVESEISSLHSAYSNFVQFCKSENLISKCREEISKLDDSSKSLEKNEQISDIHSNLLQLFGEKNQDQN